MFLTINFAAIAQRAQRFARPPTAGWEKTSTLGAASWRLSYVVVHCCGGEQVLRSWGIWNEMLGILGEQSAEVVFFFGHLVPDGYHQNHKRWVADVAVWTESLAILMQMHTYVCIYIYLYIYIYIYIYSYIYTQWVLGVVNHSIFLGTYPLGYGPISW